MSMTVDVELWIETAALTVTVVKGLVKTFKDAGTIVGELDDLVPTEDVPYELATLMASYCGAHFPSEARAEEEGEEYRFVFYGECGSVVGERFAHITAHFGFTGAVTMDEEAVGSFRYSIENGKVSTDYARILYTGDVDTDGWIAQLQARPGGGLDHVRVVGSESAARAQVATWCRADFATAVARGEFNADALAADADDETAIATWSTLTGGVHHQVAAVA